MIKRIAGGICAARGFRAAGVHCGIRHNPGKKDLALISCAVPCAAAAVYTQNKVKGAPIAVCKAHLADGRAQAVIVNSGNANTCNADGIEIANAMCQAAAEALGIAEEDMLIASTGVIGQPLPLEPILKGIPEVVAQLTDAPEGSLAAEQAIMTTDTREKECAVEFSLAGKTCHVGGIAKGSGMIHINMATMLAFATTDVAISPAMLDRAMRKAVDATFNMVTVDGDTSTNDTYAILASGLAGNPEITGEGDDFDAFVAALTAVSEQLARGVAQDGEGATKLLAVTVSGAPDLQLARVIAKTVAGSNLLKAAMFGADANWGRVLCAMGYADADYDISKTSVAFRSMAGLLPVC